VRLAFRSLLGSWRSACLVAVVVLAPARAHGQATADEKVAAEALFDEGKRLLTDGQLGPACEKLEQSQRIDRAVGTLLYLAECYEKSGRSASAWATFREASSAARASGQADRARIGQERAARIEPRLVRLTIQVENENAAVDGFQVKRRGELVPKALWGVPVPVDPGEQLIEATAPGYQPYSQRVSIDKQPGSAIVPALTKLVSVDTVPPTKPSTAPTQPAAPMTPSLPPPTDAPPPSNAQASVGITLGAIGLVGVGFGTYFGLRARSKNNEAKGYCRESPKCSDAQGPELTEQASQAAVLSNIAFSVGGTALVAGGVLLLTAPTRARKSGLELRFVPVAGAREVGAHLLGSF
jgi:hypothetical protein